MQIAPGVTIGGKYELEQPLARGGMGAVWVARHVKLGSAVAIKFLDAHLAAAPALVARFEREARAAANLDTPHVVHVHDYGVEDGTPYLVMELLRGEDLNTRLRHRGRLSLPEAAKVLTQMGRGLRRAHDAGIVHRDLKPANVFLARIDDDEVVKVLDFGIAKDTWSRVEESTKTGEVFGSPHYMSPEQARAQKDVDHRADLWATGVIAYRMITGTLPFPGEVLGEVLSSVLVDPFPPMAQVAPDLPAAFDGFFARALAKKKQERFSSVAELLEAFAAASGAGPSPGFASEITGHSTAPTLEPHLPLAAEPVAVPVPVPVASFAPVVAQAPPGPPGPAAQPMGQPGASQSAPRRPASVTDTTAPTQVYRPSSPVLETAPFAMPSEQGAGERTGPSIANATSSLFPDVAPPRRGRTTLLVIGAAALAALVVALVFFGRSSSSGSGGPDASASSNASATGNSTGGAPESPPTAEPTLAPPPAAPTAEASVQFVPPEPTSSAKAVATAALSSGPLKAVSTSPPRTTAAPTGTAAPKKRRDWGLN